MNNYRERLVKALIKFYEGAIEAHKINIEVLTSEQFGLDGDSIEAEAFAYLAVKSLLGEPYTFKNTTGIKKECSGGVLYYFRSY